MKKLIIVDVPDDNTGIFVVFQKRSNGKLEAINHKELDPLTPAEIHYLLTLCGHNEDGKQLALENKEIVEKLKLML